ncbi:MAG TPA: hypothetical protein VGO47_00900, partial [Chlamydiales bacterium]|nr:hypothetical protein [Chlamydiales bacterium]
GHDEVDKLRTRIEEEEKRAQEAKSKDEFNQQSSMEETKFPVDKDAKMDDTADDLATNGDKEQTKDDRPAKEPEKDKDTTKEGDVVMAADGDDAVEY